MNEQQIEKPTWLENENLEAALLFLDELRESGITNMFGARPYLQEWWADEYILDKLTDKEASELLTYWMKTFSKRHGLVQS
jgi:hypothetical protein